MEVFLAFKIVVTLAAVAALAHWLATREPK